MRHDNVRPCPFCGCTAISVREMSGYFRASCGRCEATASYQESEPEAIARWNRRASDRQEREGDRQKPACSKADLEENDLRLIS